MSPDPGVSLSSWDQPGPLGPRQRGLFQIRNPCEKSFIYLDTKSIIYLLCTINVYIEPVTKEIFKALKTGVPRSRDPLELLGLTGTPLGLD